MESRCVRSPALRLHILQELFKHYLVVAATPTSKCGHMHTSPSDKSRRKQKLLPSTCSGLSREVRWRRLSWAAWTEQTDRQAEERDSHADREADELTRKKTERQTESGRHTVARTETVRDRVTEQQKGRGEREAKTGPPTTYLTWITVVVGVACLKRNVLRNSAKMLKSTGNLRAECLDQKVEGEVWEVPKAVCGLLMILKVQPLLN